MQIQTSRGSVRSKPDFFPRAADRGTAATEALGRAERLRMPALGALAGLIVWAVLRRRGPGQTWRSAFAMGLLSGSFSTAVVSLGAQRIGRNRAEDWMNVGTVLRGAASIREQPRWPELAAGIAVHQSADLGWAVLLFGLAGSRLKHLPPTRMLALALPWAAFSSAVEYYLLLPWLQPLLPRQVPYWAALTVHVASGSSYPLFPWVHARVSGEPDTAARGTRRTALVLGAVLTALAVLERRGRRGHEPRLPVGDRYRQRDRLFMRRTVAHHERGLRMARLVAGRAQTPELRMLGRLMVAQQSAELDLLRGWWRGWYGEPMPALSEAECARMPGMPHPAAVEALAALAGAGFERRFIALMLPHHAGMLLMCRNARRGAGDPRLSLFARSVAHAQQSQIERLRAQPHAPVSTVAPTQLYARTRPADAAAEQRPDQLADDARRPVAQ